MLEQVILGTIQGIFEWLPVSSEGVIVLAAKILFKNESGLDLIIRQALFLHLGTFLAALIYFRKEVIDLIKALGDYKSAQDEIKKLLIFLIITTLISGLLGFCLLKFFIELEELLYLSARVITLAVGLLLLITALLQIKAEKDGQKKQGDLKVSDGILLGLVQGLSALPGLSRSGLTISVLLLRKFNGNASLKLSFLMSLPIVLGSNIVLNFRDFVFLKESIWGLFFAFVFGLLTIDLLLRLARKINFGWFVLIFGVLIVITGLFA